MILGCRFTTAAFSFSKRLKTEMNKRVIYVEEIKYFLFHAKGDHKIEIVGTG